MRDWIHGLSLLGVVLGIIAAVWVFLGSGNVLWAGGLVGGVVVCLLVAGYLDPTAHVREEQERIHEVAHRRVPFTAADWEHYRRFQRKGWTIFGAFILGIEIVAGVIGYWTWREGHAVGTGLVGLVFALLLGVLLLGRKASKEDEARVRPEFLELSASGFKMHEHFTPWVTTDLGLQHLYSVELIPLDGLWLLRLAFRKGTHRTGAHRSVEVPFPKSQEALAREVAGEFGRWLR